MELAKDAGDGFLYLAVGCLLHSLIFRADIADRNLRHHHAAPDLLTMCFHRPLAKQTDLELAHGALETEQETIVEQTGIIDAVVVDDQGPGHRA